MAAAFLAEHGRMPFEVERLLRLWSESRCPQADEPAPAGLSEFYTDR